MARLGRRRTSPNYHLYGPSDTAPPLGVSSAPRALFKISTGKSSRRYRVPHHHHLYGPASNLLNLVPTGTLAKTMGPFTVAAAGFAAPTGSLARTMGAFTLAATGTHAPTSAKVLGTIWTKTLTGAGGSETFTASAAVEASLVYTVLHGATGVDQTSSVTGATDIADSPSVNTVNPDELVLWAHFRDAAAITVVPGTGTNVGPIQSSATATRASTAVNFQGQPAVGASGTRRFAGAASNAWAAATISITGTSPLITGTLARTMGPFTLAAAGTFTLAAAGTLAATMDPFTVSASFTHTQPPGSAPTPTLRGALTSFPRLRKGFSAPRLD